MKYYKLFAAINPLEPNHYYLVDDTISFSHAPDKGLKFIRALAKRYLDAGVDCYIRGYDEFKVGINELD